MKLQTQIPLKKAKNQIDYDSQILLLGSCFVENMGKKFDYLKFRTLQNPFGILFHPLAIERLITGAVHEKCYSGTDIFQQRGLWHCFDAHSYLSDPSQEKLLRKLNDGLKATLKSLRTTSHIIITLGTSWVYRYRESGDIVANCHKVHSKNFSKELIAIPEIVSSLGRVAKLIQSINPTVQLIFTISPIRHLKDGFVENHRSKAHLISALQQFCNTSESVMADGAEHSGSSYNDLSLGDGANKKPVKVTSDGNSQITYFPSYEIMMDELRDYRFYERDLVHPNELAIDYIWEKFKTVWISEGAHRTMDEVTTVQKGLQHRPFHPESAEHRKFLKLLKTKITTIRRDYPFMEF